MTDRVKTVEVIGVYLVPNAVEVYLVEILLSDPDGFDFGEVTQAVEGVAEENWQVAYDEQPVTGEKANQYAFFFHHLDSSKPLQTSFGSVELPPVTPMPSHLSPIEYERP